MKRLNAPRNMILVIVMLAMAFGCASKTDLESMQSQQRRQDMEQRNRITELEKELAAARNALQDEIKRSNDPLRSKTADIWSEISKLRREFAQLQGQFEVMNVRLDTQLGDDDNATLAIPAVESRLRNLEFVLTHELNLDIGQDEPMQATATPVEGTGGDPATIDEATTITVGAPENQAASAEAAPAEAAPAAIPTPTPNVGVDAAKALYDSAYGLYKEKKYEQAMAYWTEFTETFTKHPYIASATFWIGQCNYRLKDYASAAVRFGDVVEKYPTSQKYKTAMYMLGVSLTKIGQEKYKALGIQQLQEVVRKFPESIEARQAQKQLEKLK